MHLDFTFLILCPFTLLCFTLLLVLRDLRLCIVCDKEGFIEGDETWGLSVF